MLLAIVTYIDRVCISQAAPLVSQDLGLTKVQMAWVFSVFGWAYALFEIPGGWLADRRRSPEDQTLLKEQVEAVWDVAANLPERQKTVFLLRFVEDMDLLEIAAVTGMKEGTVKTHLFRALQAVREQMGARS